MKTIRIDVAVPMTAEKVWAAITDPEQRRAWFGGNYEIDPVEGGIVRIDLPEDGVHASGILRTYGAPHVLEHTFVEDSAPDIESVCRWGVTRTGEGSMITFEQAGVSPAQHDQLAPTWSRLLGATSPEVSRADAYTLHLTKRSPCFVERVVCCWSPTSARRCHVRSCKRDLTCS